MIQILLNMRNRLCDPNNCRAIALSSMFCKSNEQSSLLFSELKLVQEGSLYNAVCTNYSMRQTIIIIINLVCVLLLDASKGFDMVNYCKLFMVLIREGVSPPLVLRLLVIIRLLSVGWFHVLSNLFKVKIVLNKVVCYRQIVF